MKYEIGNSSGAGAHAETGESVACGSGLGKCRRRRRLERAERRGRCGEMLFPFVYDDDAVKQIGCIVCNGRFQEQQAIERFFRIWRVH